MSPHNYARFNGSPVHSKHSYHRNQNALGLAMGDLMSYIGKGLYKYSGLKMFFTYRLFHRGVSDNALTLFSK